MAEPAALLFTPISCGSSTASSRRRAPTRPTGRRLRSPRPPPTITASSRPLRPIYGAAWISTGASKGGMTVMYHRRFYPADVDGTVAYVAPQDVVNSEDSALRPVLHHRRHRPGLPRRAGQRAGRGAEAGAPRWSRVTRRGRPRTDRTFDDRRQHRPGVRVHGRAAPPWAFWQYSDQSRVRGGAGRDRLRPTRSSTGSTRSTAWTPTPTRASRRYVPYYYQAATQLGYPYIKLRHLARAAAATAGRTSPKSYVPRELAPRFKPLDHGRRRPLGPALRPAAAVRLRRERPVGRRAVPPRARHPATR